MKIHSQNFFLRSIFFAFAFLFFTFVSCKSRPEQVAVEESLLSEALVENLEPLASDVELDEKDESMLEEGIVVSDWLEKSEEDNRRDKLDLIDLVDSSDSDTSATNYISDVDDTSDISDINNSTDTKPIPDELVGEDFETIEEKNDILFEEPIVESLGFFPEQDLESDENQAVFDNVVSDEVADSDKSEKKLIPVQTQEVKTEAKIWQGDLETEKTDIVPSTEEAITEIEGLQRTPIQVPSPPASPQVAELAQAPQITQAPVVQTPSPSPPIQEATKAQEIKTENIQEAQFAEPEEKSLPEIKELASKTKADAKNNQFLEIRYPGSGWIYIGEEGQENFVSYVGRKIVDGDTLFTLKTTKPGLTRLEFYKSDPLSQSYIEDTIELTISDERALDSEKKLIDSYDYEDALKAPEAITAENEGQKLLAGSQSALSDEPELEELAFLPPVETMPSEMLLASAKESMANNAPEDALLYLDEFLRVSLDNTDEAWFLRGQLYEKPGKMRNIQLARESYQTIVDAYPSSAFWKQASDRILYIDKFFFIIK